MMNLLLFLFCALVTLHAVDSWSYGLHRYSSRSIRPKGQKTTALFSQTSGSELTVPAELKAAVLDVAKTLWGADAWASVLFSQQDEITEGEAHFPSDLSFSTRLDYFLDKALAGDAAAQHSAGLLLWSGFCVKENEVSSAAWHAAAACQGHLDSMTVLGGCLRKGIGVPSNSQLGLKLIDYTASVGNPAGVNKKAAMQEENDNYQAAARLYEECLQGNRANALLYFNMGYLLVNGANGVEKDVPRGEELWRCAVDLAPDEGSEEAAFFMYQRVKYTDEEEADQLLQLSADLGYPDALDIVES